MVAGMSACEEQLKLLLSRKLKAFSRARNLHAIEYPSAHENHGALDMPSFITLDERMDGLRTAVHERVFHTFRRVASDQYGANAQRERR